MDDTRFAELLAEIESPPDELENTKVALHIIYFNIFNIFLYFFVFVIK
jgi:hypothetical protein